MRYPINSLTDMHTILSNERKIGGAVETEYIRLRSGETFANAVIVGIHLHGNTVNSICFMTNEGKRLICHVDDIGMMSDPVHKNICDLNNETFKNIKTAEKLKYLKKLVELNKEGCTPMFEQEAQDIIADIGADAVTSKIEMPFSAEAVEAPVADKIRIA